MLLFSACLGKYKTTFETQSKRTKAKNPVLYSRTECISTHPVPDKGRMCLWFVAATQTSLHGASPSQWPSVHNVTLICFPASPPYSPEAGTVSMEQTDLSGNNIELCRTHITGYLTG